MYLKNALGEAWWADFADENSVEPELLSDVSGSYILLPSAI